MDPTPLQVMIVDDTVVYRKILTDVVNDCPGAVVTCTAPQGRIALAKLATTPIDVVFLDMEMPDMGGLETLGAIKLRWPDMTVVMIASTSSHNEDNTVRALEIGALDFIMKPDGNDMEANRKSLLLTLKPLLRHVLTQRNLKMATPRLVLRPPTVTAPSTPIVATGATHQEPAPPPRLKPTTPPALAPQAPTAPSPVASVPPQRVEVVVVGISTGGPNALQEFIPALPLDLGVPVLLVQHMPPGFTASLASHLDQRSRLKVKEAEDGETILPNTVYIAPGGRHMVMRRVSSTEGPSPRMVIGLNDHPPEHSCRPSVDVLFRSIATHMEGKVLAVVMTGMGSDGTEGVRALKRKGARCVTQSEASCVVYGMPQAVDEAGLSDESIGLVFLGRRVAELVRSSRTVN